MLGQRLPKVSGNVTYETMYRDFRDAMADDGIHGLSDSTKGWLIYAEEIQLGFGRSQRINR